MDAVGQFAQLWTVPNLLFGLTLSLVWSLLQGAAMRAFSGKRPKRGLWYWLSVTGLAFVAFVCLLTLVSILSRQQISLMAHQAREDARPQFHLAVEQVTSGALTDERGRQTSFAVLIATIANTGEPSAISGIGLSAKLTPDAEPTAGTAQTLPKELRVPLRDGTVITFSAEDALNVRAQVEPIPKGGMRRGVMLYTFPNIPPAALNAITTVYELAVTDIWGNSYSASSKGLTPMTELKQYPQLHLGITKPEPPVSGGRR